MKVLGSGARPELGCAVTIGAFDGVHLGHRALIEIVKQRAGELGVASAVVTFDRHPASVVRPESAPLLLTDLDQKLELLEQTGVDYTLVVPFNMERAAEPANKFVEEVLVRRLGAKAVIVGYDFHFGKGRSGNVALLKEMGADHGFAVQELSAVSEDQVTVSSTEIRKRLGAGDVETAATMLGRPHEVRGLVLMGDGRGRELGYPTANVHLPTDIALPADGVYAGEYVLPDATVKQAAVSLGTRPTFYADGVNILEAYVLDFDGDLYGQHAKVRFTQHLRDQVRFESIDDLVAQIAHDVDAVRAAGS